MPFLRWKVRAVSVAVAVALLATGLPAIPRAVAATPKAVAATALQDVSVSGGTTSPLVVSMDVSAADQSVLKSVLLSQPTSTPFSDEILTELDAYPLLAATPKKTDAGWFTYDGTVGLANGVLSITIPLADVHTQIPGWLTQIIAGTLAVGAWWLAAALCTATVTRAAPIICRTCREL